MPNLSFSIGQIKITPFFWCLALAFIFSSFFLWRELKKEDMADEEIYQLTLFILLSGLVFSFFTSIVIKSALFGAFWGTAGMMYFRLKQTKIFFWDGFEALSLPLLIFLVLGSLGIFLRDWNWQILFYGGIGMVGFFLRWYLGKNYRRFAWYKSGKPGIVFWLLSVYVFALFSVLAFWQKTSLYLVLLLLVSLIVCAGVIYLRSERKPREDLKNIFKFKN